MLPVNFQIYCFIKGTYSKAHNYFFIKEEEVQCASSTHKVSHHLPLFNRLLATRCLQS